FLTILSDASSRAPVGSSTKIVNFFCSVLPRYSVPRRDKKNIETHKTAAHTHNTRWRERIDRNKNFLSMPENFFSQDPSPCAVFCTSMDAAKEGREHIIGTKVTAHSSDTVKETTMVAAIPEYRRWS